MKWHKKTIEKNQKDSRKFNDKKTSLQSKWVCEDLERTAIDKKKIENIHKESNKESIKSSVEHYHSNWYKGTRSIKPSVGQCNNNRYNHQVINKIYVAYKNVFSDIKTEKIHNYYFCQERSSRHTS